MSEGPRLPRPRTRGPAARSPGDGGSPAPSFCSSSAGWVARRAERKGCGRPDGPNGGDGRLRFCARSLGGAAGLTAPCPAGPSAIPKAGAGPVRRPQLLFPVPPGAVGCVSQRRAEASARDLPVRPKATDLSTHGRAIPAASATQSPCLLSSRGGCVRPTRRRGFPRAHSPPKQNTLGRGRSIMRRCVCQEARETEVRALTLLTAIFGI